MIAMKNQTQQVEHRTEYIQPCRQGGKCQVPMTREETGQGLWRLQISRVFNRNICIPARCTNLPEPLWRDLLANRKRELKRTGQKPTSIQGSIAGANRHPGCSALQQKCRPERWLTRMMHTSAWLCASSAMPLTSHYQESYAERAGRFFYVPWCALMQDADAKVREARKAEVEAHKLRVAKVEKQRKQQTKLLRKRTRLGQPVMRYRMDKLLGQLQAEAQGS